MNIYSRLSTEALNPRSTQLDQLSTLQALKLLQKENLAALRAFAAAEKSLARAVEVCAEALRRKTGKIYLVGAGTSGRLAVMEAAEMPPTFGTPSALFQSIMAGGKSSVFRSKEGAEDDALAARQAAQKFKAGDVVIGIAASGITPFVKAALERARRQKARAILLTCNPQMRLPAAEIIIALPTGAEVLSGSTRLKAGTATKLALNAITLLSMVQVGKVYGNRMVDLSPRSKKLYERAIRLTEELGRVSRARAISLLKACGWKSKTAIVMARKNVGARKAQQILQNAGGFLRRVIG